MPVQFTSLRAYFGEVINTLGERQKVVLEAFTKRENFSNNELAHFLNLPINVVTPRVFELREAGLVQEAGVRTCNITGRTVKAWELVNKQNQNKKLFI